MSNNNEYLYSQIEKCSQTNITNLLEDNISNKDIENIIENIKSNISSKIEEGTENAINIFEDCLKYNYKNKDIEDTLSELPKLNDKSPNINIYIYYWRYQ